MSARDDQQSSEGDKDDEQSWRGEEGGDSDEGGRESGGEQEELSYLAPLMALPSSSQSLLQPDSGEEGGSTSPAFIILDQLFSGGKLTATKAALLKSKYTQLHDELTVRRAREQALLRQARDGANVLEQQQRELKRAGDFPDNANTEVSQLRLQLLQHNNTLAQTEERNYQYEYTIECLLDDKRMITKEADRLPKHGEVEKRVEELRLGCTELHREVNARRTEVKTLREDIESSARLQRNISKQLEALREDEQRLQSDLAAVYSEPQTIQKEGERLQRHKNEAEKSLREVEAQIKQLHATIQATKLRIEDTADQQLHAERDAKERSPGYFEQQKTQTNLVTDFKYAKENEMVLRGDRATLDMNINQVSIDRDAAHELHARRARERDRELRQLKKAELQLKVAQDALDLLQQGQRKLALQAGGMPKDDGSMRMRIEELRKERDQTSRALAAQNGLSSVERVRIEQTIADSERLLYELSDLKVEIVELTHLTNIKTEEKIQKGRDLKEAEQQYSQSRQELATKNVVLDDHKKQEQEMLVRLNEFAQLYDVIKNERNKCVSLIQTSAQKATEMREKLKILQNELEILRTSASHNERQLQKQSMRCVSGVAVRDSLRREVRRREAQLGALREQRVTQRTDITRLDALIKQSEGAMVELRKRYEVEVKNRNERGIQLVERNQEVCIFYEKLNIQEQVLRNGSVEVRAREEEIRFLRLQLGEEQRALELLRKSLPNKRATEQQLVTLQIQLAQCQDKLLAMERQVENPTEERVRMVEGKDVSAVEIQSKLEQLEERLAVKETQSLEKDLVFEQVSRLTDRVSQKVGVGKEDTLALAKQMNSYQRRLREVTRRQMSLVSELSLQQASVLRLQQELRSKETQLEQCYARMQQGLAPCAELEHDWLRTVRDEQDRRAARHAAKLMAEQEEALTLPGGVSSTAEQRPSAYIPSEEHELPLPRPYGGYAPFKPSEPGSSMRHIRKPVPKPIEI